MKKSAILDYIRNNGIEINNPFEVEYIKYLFKPKAKEVVTIIKHEERKHDPIFGEIDEINHLFTLSDGSEITSWDHEIK